MVPNSRPGATYLHLVKPTRNHTHCRIYLVVHGDDDDDDEEKDDKRKKVEGRLIWDQWERQCGLQTDNGYRHSMPHNDHPALAIIVIRNMIMVIHRDYDHNYVFWVFYLSILMFCRLCEIFFRSRALFYPCHHHFDCCPILKLCKETKKHTHSLCRGYPCNLLYLLTHM